jgi:hypothetical protein
MKKFPFNIIFLLIFFSANLYAQDFSLYNPSNDISFSAYDEGAMPRYNPAVLILTQAECQCEFVS